KTDHFNNRDGRTWFQRYYYGAEYWDGNPNAPIFFELGMEAEFLQVIAEMDYYLWAAAKAHRGLTLFVEHRYYGPSQPTGGRFSDEDLVLLTTEQAIADFAALLVSVRAALNNSTGPVILSGCSYSGELAAFMRVKYPHLAIGAVAGSPNARFMSANMDRFFP